MRAFSLRHSRQPWGSLLVSAAVALLILEAITSPAGYVQAFVPIHSFRSPATASSNSAFLNSRPGTTTTTRRFVAELEKTQEEQQQEQRRPIAQKRIPRTLRIEGSGIPSRQEKIQLLDSSTYESYLLQQWDDGDDTEGGNTAMQGFDWEIEKARRWFAGLRMRDDGTWVKQPSLFDFLVSPSRFEDQRQINRGPPAAGLTDSIKVFGAQVLTSIGFGPAIGMAKIPNAVIQKYEGSFLSFIKGVLGGDLQTLAGGPLFLLLAKYFAEYGPIFNLSFGPKSFLVISDPVMARHVLREAPTEAYCKGMLAEILQPIMGKGLIPADPATWRVRRRAIVPGFHKKWLNRMVNLFADRAEILVDDLKDRQGTKVDLEERFCSVSLDIIGKAVFNYDFGSVTKESPVVKAVYRVLREAEHRSSSFIPYWDLPYADQWMGGQVEFRKDMTMLDDILADLINKAVATRREATVEELEERDNSEDPSLLRFLVDMRGEDLSSMVLRDDLMTMLIAGHETTAAMLTWALFELYRGDEGLLKDIQAEVRTVLKGKDRPDYDDIVAMKKLRYALIESLRLYPEPPLLIRRSRADDTLPQGSSSLGQDGIKVLRGTDMFISTWNLHRSPDLWENPDVYDPSRFDRPFRNPGVQDWQGYDPDKVNGLYPNEIAADFAFLPYGGGQRKCVGDQFAMMEATVIMAMVLKDLDFDWKIDPDKVGMRTGATIHTMNGLMLSPRSVDNDKSTVKPSGWWEKQHLQRGLNAQGRPFDSPADDEPTTSSAYRAVIEDEKATPPQQKKKDGDDSSSSSGCPMHP